MTTPHTPQPATYDELDEAVTNGTVKVLRDCVGAPPLSEDENELWDAYEEAVANGDIPITGDVIYRSETDPLLTEEALRQELEDYRAERIRRRTREDVYESFGVSGDACE